MMASARVFGGCRPLMAAAKSAAVGASGRSASSGRKAKSGPNLGGLMRTMPVSPAMRKFLGVPEISRPDAVKKIWDYIKLHQLQNPANKREINCDERLKAIFGGKDKVGMLEIAKLISPHFVKAQ
ncbi:hypothetical protein Taro_056150 [Colocasia esculenta]|uniref:DM2 domain-containing protein n=1 Tax=Colocasia esculenta TaxID=4460 RepID=A0A843XT57_COLES|nr:hypothetical protein [Colocasia esculenta]